MTRQDISVLKKPLDTGRDPTEAQVRESRRVRGLSPDHQKSHPSAVKADHTKLTHINTYGALPEFYLDQAFTCRKCGKVEIWRAADQKWYYEEAKGHIDARAVECHACRAAKKAASTHAPKKRAAP